MPTAGRRDVPARIAVSRTGKQPPAGRRYVSRRVPKKCTRNVFAVLPGNRWGEALAACLPFAVKRALPARLKRPVKRWLGARRAAADGSG